MDKAKYTKRLYKENINFKIYIDKLLADSHDYNQDPDIWENETVYQVGLYYEQLQKSGVAITNDPSVPAIVAKELYCSCDKEDKSC